MTDNWKGRSIFHKKRGAEGRDGMVRGFVTVPSLQ
jgi:hypothetical protein